MAEIKFYRCRLIFEGLLWIKCKAYQIKDLARSPSLLFVNPSQIEPVFLSFHKLFNRITQLIRLLSELVHETQIEFSVCTALLPKDSLRYLEVLCEFLSVHWRTESAKSIRGKICGTVIFCTIDFLFPY